MANKKAVVSKECVACGACLPSCKLAAIQIVKGMYAEVDAQKCVGCGRCAYTCPASVIGIENVK